MSRDLRLLSLSLLLWGIGEGLFIYFQPLYMDELGANPIQIGGILGLAGLAMTLSHLPAGALADLIGRKTVMVAAWVSGTVAAGTMFLSTSLPPFTLGLVLYSFSGFVLSPMSSYITEARGQWSLTRALTTASAFFSIGSILGPLLGGLLAEKWGLSAIYGIATAIFALSCMLVFFVRSQPIEPTVDGPRYHSLLKNVPLGRFLFLVFSGIFALYLSWPLTPIFLQQERLVSVSSLGVFGSLNAVGMVILNLALGGASPRLGFLLVHFIVGASILSLWRGAGVLWFGLGYFLAAGYRTARSFITAQVEQLIQRRQMGLAYGLAETVNGSVLLIASPIAGFLYRNRPELPFIVSLALIGSSFLLLLRFGPRRQRIQEG